MSGRSRRTFAVASSALGRALRLRELALFAAAALIPAIGVGVLGLRAVRNEEAGARRELALEIDASAERTTKAVAASLDRAATTMREAKLRGSDAEAANAVRSIAPSFAEVIVIAANGDVRFPAPPAPIAAFDPICAPAVRAIDDAAPAERARALATIEARCPEARTSSGRWLWPIAAIDRAGSPDESAKIAAWIDAHATRLADAEREVTKRAIAESSMNAGDRARAESALDRAGESHEDLAARLREPSAASALHAANARSIVAWRGASLGVLRDLGDGRLAGYFVDAEALVEAARRGALDVGPGLVVSRFEPRGSLRAKVSVTPELSFWLAPSDPSVVAKSAARGRFLLAAMGIVTTVFAFACAAVVYARVRAARRSSDLRTDFVSTVSHELRTPIASVRMFAELLDEDRVEPNERAEVHAALAREARRLGETVDRLLGFSRMEAGRYAIDRELGEIAAPVARSIDTFLERHPGAAVDRDLDRSVRAHVDAAQLELAVDNLLANALKYAPKGGPYRVRVARDKGRAVVSVEDRGPGVARRDQRRIFEPFERADDRLSRATEGSGIGLALVRHVARAHGGDARVESDKDRGACFTITILIGDET